VVLEPVSRHSNFSFWVYGHREDPSKASRSIPARWQAPQTLSVLLWDAHLLSGPGPAGLNGHNLEQREEAGSTLPGPVRSPMTATTGSFGSLGIILWRRDSHKWPRLPPFLPKPLPPQTSSKPLIHPVPVLNTLDSSQSHQQGLSEPKGL
jgi:hypothetical protein